MKERRSLWKATLDAVPPQNEIKKKINGSLPEKFKTSCHADRSLDWMYSAFLVVQQP